jgi:CheY-like chemotaxis protein
MTDPSARRRVLVAVATADEADSLRTLLTVWGCDVRTAIDGPSAVAAAEVFRPGVALLDLRLDGVSRPELARRLRASPGLSGVTLVALAGRACARSDGFDHFLTLPVDPEALRRIVGG